jgi:hypothetical protein
MAIAAIITLVNATAFVATAAAQEIQVQPPGWSITVQKGQSASQLFTLSKTGTSEYVWDATTDASWLKSTTSTYQTITTEVDRLGFRVDTSTMPVGTNRGTIWITSIDAMNRSYLRTIPVTITVTQSTIPTQPAPSPSTVPPPPSATPPPPPSPSPVAIAPPPPPPPSTSPPPPATSPQITVNPVTLAFSLVKGQTGSAVLSLSKSGTSEHVWELSEQVPWLSLSRTWDGITTEVDQSVVTINTSALSAGSYSATIYLSALDQFNMPYYKTVPVSLKVSASGSTTPPPPSTTPPPPPPSTTPPPPPPASPPPSPLPIGGAGGVVAPPPPPPAPTTASLSVTWTANSEADMAGYRLYVGTSSGVYNQPIQVGKTTTSYVVTGLPKGQTYFIAVSAYDTSGNESQKSSEVSKSLF